MRVGKLGLRHGFHDVRMIPARRFEARTADAGAAQRRRDAVGATVRAGKEAGQRASLDLPHRGVNRRDRADSGSCAKTCGFGPAECGGPVSVPPRSSPVTLGGQFDLSPEDAAPISSPSRQSVPHSGQDSASDSVSAAAALRLDAWTSIAGCASSIGQRFRFRAGSEPAARNSEAFSGRSRPARRPDRGWSGRARQSSAPGTDINSTVARLCTTSAGVQRRSIE